MATQTATGPKGASNSEHASNPIQGAEKHVQGAEKRLSPAIGFITKFSNDWTFSFAGTMAYSLLTALLPIAVALLAILGLVLGSNTGLHDTIINSVTGLFPGASNIKQLANTQIEKFSKEAGILAIIAIVLAVFGGSRLFLGMEGIMDIIYRVRPRPMLRQNLMAFEMMLLFIVLVPVMVFASLGPSLVLGTLQNLPIIKSVPGISFVVVIGGYLGGLLAGFIFFISIYIVVPNQRISFKNSWCGALAAAVAMELFVAFVFPFYTGHFLGGYAGPIGFAIVILLFLYYFALILLLGAEVNAYFFEKIRPIPNDIATFISTTAGTLNKDIPAVESKAHIDPKPTVNAGKAYIAEVRSKEQQATNKNAQKQQDIASKAVSKDQVEIQKAQEKEKKRQKRKTNMLTAAEVVAGSGLAFVVSLLRLRRK